MEVKVEHEGSAMTEQSKSEAYRIAVMQGRNPREEQEQAFRQRKDNLREDFEEYIINFYGQSIECLERNGLGMYCDCAVQGRWAGWQACAEKYQAEISKLDAHFAAAP